MTTHRQAEPRAGQVAQPRRLFRIRFLSEVISELRKVVWPTREESTRLTVMVIVVSVSVGLALGLIDIGFSELVRRVFVG